MKPSSHKDNTPDIFFTDSSSCVFAVPSFSPPPSTFAALARHSRLSRSARLSACCRSAASRWLSTLSAIHCGQLPAGSWLHLPSTVDSQRGSMQAVCVRQRYSRSLTRTFLSLLRPESVLHVCVSLPLLKTGSSVSFSRFCVYVLIYEVCFSLSDQLIFNE